MTDTDRQDRIDAHAPSERREHQPWPIGWRIVAYAVLAAVAIASIVYIDRGVMRTISADTPAADQP